MRNYYEFANFLVASWRLAQPGEKLPTSHGVLDRALKQAVADLPEPFADKLTFVDTPIGTLCSELPDILRAAQESYLTSEPNPTYRTAEIKVGAATAMTLLDDLGIDIEDAKSFGKTLAQLVAKEANALRSKAAA